MSAAVVDHSYFAAQQCREMSCSRMPDECRVHALASSPTENVSRANGILVVEDDRLLRNALSEGLRNQGFHVCAAANGAEGVELYRDNWPLIDVVLSDVRMPVLDGPRTLEALRDINPSVRLCFMTGDTRAATLDSLLRQGAVRVFEKPIPSIAKAAQELWDLATRPHGLVTELVPRIIDNPGPGCSVRDASVSEIPERHLIEGPYRTLLTCISRIQKGFKKWRLPTSSGTPPPPNQI